MGMKRKKPLHYWFKPKRFWWYFAAYYPVSWEGWIVTGMSIGSLIFLFRQIDEGSYSAGDTLIGFAPWLILVLIIFDIASRLAGQYPSWWRLRK